jgi:hypothetical protein
MNTFEVSMNLLRYMMCVQLSLKQISHKPLKDFDDDIEHIKKYLAYLGSDSHEILSLFKRLGIHVEKLIDNKFQEKSKFKIEFKDLKEIFSTDNKRDSSKADTKINSQIKTIDGSLNQGNWFDNIGTITGVTQTGSVSGQKSVDIVKKIKINIKILYQCQLITKYILTHYLTRHLSYPFSCQIGLRL